MYTNSCEGDTINEKHRTRYGELHLVQYVKFDIDHTTKIGFKNYSLCFFDIYCFDEYIRHTQFRD